ncbi:wd40 repeat-like-containing domain [Venturia nashicola]|uniref:Wd40 repeat-like-containing domain n=1 Tax=Venturia nashicola TaxID=86259 RepID=A0A4Z1P6Z4_9PEZI|nr:wd40 repeat-like-containing domain [Venturia nashicola]
MNRGNIPGYYFDEEKKKYFKITKTQYAPEGAKYSFDNYKKEIEIKNWAWQRYVWLTASLKRKRDEIEKSRRKRQLIARPLLLRNPLATGLGSRSETGLKCSSEMLDLRSQAFVQGLEKRVLIDLSNLEGQVGRITGPSIPHIKGFEYDSATQGIMMGTQSHGNSRSVHLLTSILPSEDSSKKRPKYSYKNLRHVMAFDSEISSLSLTGQRNLITTTQGSTRDPEIHIAALLSPDLADRTRPIDGYSSVRLRTKQATTTWCSTSFPTSPALNPETVAIGTDQGILCIDLRHSEWKFREIYQCNSDVLALSWLSPTTVTGGLRTGGVVMYDIRARGGIQRFTHPSAVINIKSIDEGQRIVVAGMANEMCMYDLRMLKEENRTIRVGEGHWALNDEDGRGGGNIGGDLTWRKPFMKKVKCPKPVVNFKYNNTVYPLGMDIHARLGIVAAGEEDGNIGIWSLRSGERMRKLWTDKPPGGTRNVAEPKDFVKCLKFVEDDGPPRLMASAGQKMIEWAW